MLMQQDIIVHLSKDSGVIVVVTSPPGVFLIEEQTDVISVHLYWMEDLYRVVGEPDKIDRLFLKSDLEEKSDYLFGILSTQLYADKKWKYLYKGISQE